MVITKELSLREIKDLIRYNKTVIDSSTDDTEIYTLEQQNLELEGIFNKKKGEEQEALKEIGAEKTQRENFYQNLLNKYGVFAGSVFDAHIEPN